MVDIHVIPNPGFEDNLKEVIAALTHPRIIVHQSGYVAGNLLAARLAAYRLGTNPYVSWVDGDDRVLSVTWLDHALGMLESDPTIAAVYPRWVTVKNGKRGKGSPIHEWNVDLHTSFSSVPLAHHLTIMRRSQVIGLLEEAHDAVGCLVKSADRFYLSGIARYGRLVALDDVAYEWHLREGTGRSHDEPLEVVNWLRKRAAQDVKLARLKQLWPAPSM